MNQLFGIVDAADGVNEAKVTDEGGFLHRIVGADGATQATVTNNPQPSDAGIVVQSSVLQGILDTLTLILEELRK